MKFYCESCGAKYSISDEKVRGKILKVRCKKCTNIITVREPREPAAVKAASPAPSRPSTPSPAALAWYYSINGQSFGPYEFDALDGMYASGQVGDASYVWNETMASWKPVYEVPEFREALDKAREERPRIKTIGVTSQIEAIKPVDAAPSDEEEGFVPSSASSNPFASTSEPKEELSDRLEALRSKLKEPEEEDAPSNPFASTSEPEPESESEPAPDSEPEAAPIAEASAPRLEVPEEDLDAGFVPPSASRSPEDSSGFRGVESGQFASLTLDKPSPHDGMFTEHDLVVDDRDAVDDEDFQPSKSLLINMEEIQKQGRKKRATLGVAALLLFGGLAGTAGYMAYSAEQNKPKEEKKVAVAQKDEIVFKTYEKDELGSFIELEAEDLTGEAVPDLEAEPVEDEPVEDDTPKDEPPRVAVNSPKKTSGDDPSKFILRGPLIKSSGNKLDDALATSKKKGSSEGGLSTSKDTGAKAVKGGVDPGAGKGPKRDWGKLAVKKGTGSRAIARPEDNLGKADANKPSFSQTKLTKDQATAGFKKVARSVMFCREKQMQRAGLLDAGKIYVTVEIQGTGRVSDVSLEPSSVRSTEFAQCMSQHKTRWRFAAYDGKPVKIKKMYIVQ